MKTALTHTITKARLKINLSFDILFALRDNLFIENLLSETSRTLSMDTHYPESMDDLADCDLEEESEEQLRHQQELVAQALEIEREFWNCD